TAKLLQNRILTSLSASGKPIDFETQIKPWIGDEAALAGLDSSRKGLQLLAVASVRDKNRALAFLLQAKPIGSRSHHRVRILLYKNGTTAAIVGKMVVVGPLETVRAAIDLRSAEQNSLAAQDPFKTSISKLQEDRFAEFFLSQRGAKQLKQL